jgi:hypothetical protein
MVQAAAINMPLLAEFGDRPSQCKKEDLSWKGDHMRYYLANEMVWPVDVEHDTQVRFKQSTSTSTSTRSLFWTTVGVLVPSFPGQFRCIEHLTRVLELLVC